MQATSTDQIVLALTGAIVNAADALRLRPRRPGLPEVHVEGRGHAATRLRWKDGTGAGQELRLLDPRVIPSPPPAAFRFEAPKGTRWLK